VVLQSCLLSFLSLSLTVLGSASSCRSPLLIRDITHFAGTLDGQTSSTRTNLAASLWLLNQCQAGRLQPQALSSAWGGGRTSHRTALVCTFPGRFPRCFDAASKGSSSSCCLVFLFCTMWGPACIACCCLL
jgi:hypothetical protein